MAYRKLTLLVVAVILSAGAEGQTITESDPAVRKPGELPAQHLDLASVAHFGTGSDRLLEKDQSGLLLYTQKVLLSLTPSQSRRDSPSPEMTPAVKSICR